MPNSTSHRRGSGSHEQDAHGGGGWRGDGEGGDGGGGGNGGKLVKVAFARNQIEGEMLQGLLLEAEVPSVLKRSLGFDNPDFLSSGPHDVYVYEGLAAKAREVLAETMIAEGED